MKIRFLHFTQSGKIFTIVFCDVIYVRVIPRAMIF